MNKGYQIINAGESRKITDEAQCNLGSLPMRAMLGGVDWFKDFRQSSCILCNWPNLRLGAEEKVCKNCMEKAKVESEKLGIDLDVYIDGLHVTKELAEDNVLPGYEVKLKILKNRSKSHEHWVDKAFSIKYTRDDTDCPYCDKE